MRPRAPKRCPAGHRFTGRVCRECWPAWGGASLPERRAGTKTRIWREARERVLERDGHRCQHPGCGARAQTVDHITPVVAGAREVPPDEALQSLCWPHHLAKSSAEGNAARWPRRAES